MPTRDTKVVVDTCVVVGAYRREDGYCRLALDSIGKKRHRAVMCPKLWGEYKKHLGGHQMAGLIFAMITQRWLELEWHSDPDPIWVDFGPNEDRFHMQLAIDTACLCHVSKDNGVVTASKRMKEHGVNGVHAESCITCRKPRE